MDIIRHVTSHFNDIDGLHDKFVNADPYHMIVLDNFLPRFHALAMQKEISSIPESSWTKFTRKGSFMRECKDMSYCPSALNFVMQMHSVHGMKWIADITGINGLIPDPYLLGAGYSESFAGDSLQLHTDFNWNDDLKLHRKLSMIVYLNEEDWQADWGGNLDFMDFDNKHVVNSVPTQFNRAVIWEHHKRGFHGYPAPLQCPGEYSRKTFRLFFYVSNSMHDPDDPPHRSLYWYDEKANEPTDLRDED